MQYGEDYHYIPVTSLLSMVGQIVLPDIYCYTIQVVNVVFIGDSSKDDGWVLVDAGMPKSAKAIIEEANSWSLFTLMFYYVQNKNAFHNNLHGMHF